MKYSTEEELIKLIVLLSESNSLKTIADSLGMKEIQLKNFLKYYRQQIIKEFDISQLYIIKVIDILLDNTNEAINSINKNVIYNMIKSGKDNLSILIELNIPVRRYINLLRKLYCELYVYGSSDEKDLLETIKEYMFSSNRILNKVNKNSYVTANKKDAVYGLYHNDEMVTDKTQIIEEIYSRDDFKFIVISDTHFGNESENLDYLNMVYEYASKNGIKYIFHTGDLIEGAYSNFSRCKSQYKSIYNQVNHVIKDYCFDEGITNIILLGNHDSSALLDPIGDIVPILNERKDFDVLGYRSGYVKVNNEYISLKHVTPSFKSVAIKNYNVLLNFSGHSHHYKCTFNDSYYSFKSPTLSDVTFNRKYSRGFLSCQLSFNKGDAEELSVNYINFDEDNLSVGFERKLVK